MVGLYRDTPTLETHLCAKKNVNWILCINCKRGSDLNTIARLVYEVITGYKNNKFNEMMLRDAGNPIFDGYFWRKSLLLTNWDNYILSVSYTHLDVYKRQTQFKPQ